MDRCYEESSAGHVRNYNRGRYGYETFAAPDEPEFQEETEEEMSEPAETACQADAPEGIEEPPCSAHHGLVTRSENPWGSL
jgi:hypothetical protein